MTDRTKTGLEVLQAAVLLGVLANFTLRNPPFGVGAFLFVTAFVVALAMLMFRGRREMLTKSTVALLGAMVFFSSMFVWRQSIELRTADIFAIIVIMGVLTLKSLHLVPKISGVFHYGVGFVWAGICSAFGSGVLLTSDIDWKTMPNTGAMRHVISAARGLLVAIPLLLIFGALFVAADAAYEGMVQRVFSVPAEEVFSHIFISSVFAWLTAGYFRGVLFGTIDTSTAPFSAAETASSGDVVPQEEAKEQSKSETPSSFVADLATDTVEDNSLPNNASILEHINRSDPPNDPAPVAEVKAKTTDVPPKRSWQNFDNSVAPSAFTLGSVEVGVILGLVNLLFLSFVIVQVPYLFGGMDLVQNTPDFKLAEYARRGFGELVTVAALVLPILLLTHWLLRKDSPSASKIYRVFAGIQIALLFVIMASAGQRLFLLTGSLGYGMTTVRLYPMIFMVWLAVIFVWFGVTVLRGYRQYFAWGALWSALFVLGATHVLNPDEFIAKTNIRLMQQGRDFDAFYNAGLSNDAIPVLVNSFESYSVKDADTMLNRLRYRACTLKNQNDLQGWNLSRQAAMESLTAVGIEPVGCYNLADRFDIHD